MADQSAKPAQKKQKQKIVQEPEVPQEFQPYDYSQSNFKMFDGKRSALFLSFIFPVGVFSVLSSFVCVLNTGKLKESSQFDPNGQARGPKQKVWTFPQISQLCMISDLIFNQF